MIGIPSKLILYGIILAAGGGIVWGLIQYGRHLEATERVAAESQAIIQVLEAAADQQKQISESERVKHENLLAINDQLHVDLDRLRDRASRSEATCTESGQQGATGAELSGEDAGFLVRESARADRIREALRACYAYADTVATVEAR